MRFFEDFSVAGKMTVLVIICFTGYSTAAVMFGGVRIDAVAGETVRCVVERAP